MDVRTIRLWILTFTALGLVLPATTLRAEKVYWAQSFEDRILRANLDGTTPEILIQAPVAFDPVGVAIDPLAGKLYWAETFDETIRRANLDGTGSAIILQPPSVFDPVAIAVDPAGGKVYWAQSFGDRIRRANLDGTGSETLFEPPIAVDPVAIAVDSGAGKIYWAESPPGNQIRRGDLSGVNATTFLSIVFVTDPSALAIDTVNQKLYWAERATNRIRRADLTGLNVVTFLDSVFVTDPVAVAVDGQLGLIFWAEAAGNRIRRADLSGANVMTVLLPPALSDPVAIALGPTSICSPPNCDDGNGCTDDACVNGVCQHTNNTAPCSDGNACTTNDVCSAGTCVGGPPLICNDGFFCTGFERCDSVTSCVTPGNPCVNPANCDEGTDTCIGELPAPLPDPSGDNRPRFLSFSNPGQTGQQTAVRVKLVLLHHVAPPYTAGASIAFTAFEGQSLYIGPPVQYVESVSSGVPFMASKLQCAPYYQDWTTISLLHVTGEAIVPSSSYDVENLAAACMGLETTAPCLSGGANVSAPMPIATGRWGDVVTTFQLPTPPVTQPDFNDIGALVNKFKSALGAPIKARAMLAGEGARGLINLTPDLGFGHISACVDAFKGLPYPYKVGKCTGAATTACIDDTECVGTGPCILCP